jgi:hypothetical protein
VESQAPPTGSGLKKYLKVLEYFVIQPLELPEVMKSNRLVANAMKIIRSHRAKTIPFALALFCLSCKPDNHDRNAFRLSHHKAVLWIWDRSGDLRFLDKNEFDFALLSRTFEITDSGVRVIPRHGSVMVAESASVFPVVRLQTKGVTSRIDSRVVRELTDKICAEAARFSRAMKIQIDFDAKLSEREWYRNLLKCVRDRLPPHWLLSITAIASWCYEKEWLESLPADEIVPMFFRMGRDSSHIKQELPEIFPSFLDDAKYCPGISLDEPVQLPRQTDRLYVFNPHRWDTKSFLSLRSIISHEKND